MEYRKYGKWTIIKESADKNCFDCKCDCGKERSVRKWQLLNGRSKSCGCEPTQKRKDSINLLTGRRFGFLLVLERIKSKKVKYLCKCDCGVEKEIYGSHLTSMHQYSCGCKAIKSGAEHAQWSGVGDISGHWWKLHVDRSASQKNRRPLMDILVTKEDAWDLFLQQNKKCALTGLELIINNNPKLNTASLDRIDSSKGYVAGNIQWVHKHVNIMKNIYEQSYFVNMCKLVASNSLGS